MDGAPGSACPACVFHRIRIGPPVVFVVLSLSQSAEGNRRPADSGDVWPRVYMRLQKLVHFGNFCIKV